MNSRANSRQPQDQRPGRDTGAGNFVDDKGFHSSEVQSIGFINEFRRTAERENATNRARPNERRSNGLDYYLQSDAQNMPIMPERYLVNHVFTSYGVTLGNDPSLTAAQLELEGTAAYAVGREDLARYDAYHERRARIAVATTGRNATGAAVNAAQVGVIGATSTNPVSLPQNQNDEGHLQGGNAGGSAEGNGASPWNV